MISIRVKEPKSLRPFRKDWWNPTKQEWAPVLLQENRPFWQAQLDPDGRPWQPLKTATVDTDGKILRETGSMFTSANVRAWGNKFIVETTPYGIYHQLGTKKIPARPWMGVPDPALDKLGEIAWKHILK